MEGKKQGQKIGGISVILGTMEGKKQGQKIGGISVILEQKTHENRM